MVSRSDSTKRPVGLMPFVLTLNSLAASLNDPLPHDSPDAPLSLMRGRMMTLDTDADII